MIKFTQGNLLESDAEALVNTVNTVGVMGKGIALMFKEAFPDNFRAYALAAKSGKIEVGTIFVTERKDWISGPRWIVNFPTKKHWRQPSQIEWIVAGLRDLRRFIAERELRSIALPPLGSGNGGLDWKDVKPQIESALRDFADVDVTVYEPVEKYSNVAKRKGLKKLTPARALVAELIRRYWVLGIECSLLEIHKLAYLLERQLKLLALDNPLNLEFTANRYGPYSSKLGHLLNGLDGSYLHCDRRIPDATPVDVIWFEDTMRDMIAAYIGSEAKQYRQALDSTTELINGFESPLGMELLATVDWLLQHGTEATLSDTRRGLEAWPGGAQAGQRKQHLFDDRMIGLALQRLAQAAGSLEQARMLLKRG